MRSETEKLVEKMDHSGEQLWLVRIVPMQDPSAERWVVSPVSLQKRNGTVEERVNTALVAITSETPEAEVWDCFETSDDREILWVCALRRSSVFTGPKGRVFEAGGDKAASIEK